MSDQMKDWLRTHRDELDMEAPPIGHSERFARKLNNAPEKKISHSWVWASAAVIIVLIGASFLLGRSSGNDLTDTMDPNSLSSISPEMAEVEDHLATQVAMRFKDLKKFKDLDPKILEQDLRILSALEKEYENLKNDLSENPRDQRVVHSMIKNYRTRINVMDKMVNALESINHRNKSNEELHI